MYSNDYLPGRPAGPTRPHEDLLAPEKDPNEVPLSEAERNKLRTLAKEFGFGGETLVNQYQVLGQRQNWTLLKCVFRWQEEPRAFANSIVEPSVPAPVKRCFRFKLNSSVRLV